MGLGSTHREVLPAWPSLNPFFRVKSELESSARYVTLRWISSNRVKIKSLLQYYVAQLCIGKCQSGGPGFQLRRDRRFFLFLVFALFPSRATAQREITELFSSTLNCLKWRENEHGLLLKCNSILSIEVTITRVDQNSTHWELVSSWIIMNVPLCGIRYIRYVMYTYTRYVIYNVTHTLYLDSDLTVTPIFLRHGFCSANK